MIRKLFTILFIFHTVLQLTGCSALAAAPTPPPASLTIGMDVIEVNSLIFIAEARRFFEDQNLHVTIRPYLSGLQAVEGMLAGEVDAASATEFVMANKIVAGDEVRSWGSIDRFLFMYILARKDHGIASPADLRQKNIGVAVNTHAHFFLGRFLELNGIALDEVRLVNLGSEALVSALERGDVDAGVTWQPYATAAESILGEAALVWPAQNNQAGYLNLISAPEWAANNAGVMKRFLLAIRQAEEYLAKNPAEAKEIVRQKLSYSVEYINEIWPEHQFQLSLEQAQVIAMEDEARWMVRSGLASDGKMPVFSSFLLLGPLTAVKPEAVNIIQ